MVKTKSVSINTNTIDNTYLANGTKVRKQSGADLTQYVGEAVYENGTLSFLRMPEGRLVPPLPDEASVSYPLVPQYEYLDHLGNSRLIWQPYTSKDGGKLHHLSFEKDSAAKEDTLFRGVAEARHKGMAMRGAYSGLVTGALERELKLFRGDSLSFMAFVTAQKEQTQKPTIVQKEESKKLGLILSVPPLQTSQRVGEERRRHLNMFSFLPFLVGKRKKAEQNTQVPEQNQNDSLSAYLEIYQDQKLAPRQNISPVSLTKYEKLFITLRCKEDSAMFKLRVVGSGVGYKTFFDSVSLSVYKSPSVRVVQENHYYPFGQNMVGIEEKDQQSTSSSEEQKFQYNAKEKLDEFGLFWNDHGARNLDLQTGRWTSIDPLAEKFAQQSPYCGFDNNPAGKSDPTGKSSEDWWTKLKTAWTNTTREVFNKMQGSSSGEVKAPFKSAGVYGQISYNAVSHDSKKGTRVLPTKAKEEKLKTANSNKNQHYSPIAGNPGVALKGSISVAFMGNTPTDGFVKVEGKASTEVNLLTAGASVNVTGSTRDHEVGFVISSKKVENDTEFFENTKIFSQSAIVGPIKAEFSFNDKSDWDFKVALTDRMGLEYKVASFPKQEVGLRHTHQFMK